MASVTGVRQYSDVKYLKSIDSAHLRRGRGGRSSFSGIVCTIFGANGFVGRYVTNAIAQTGSQVVLPYRCLDFEIRDWKLMGDVGQMLFTDFDIDDEEGIAKSVKHSHVVINLLGTDLKTKNYSIDKVNVEAAAKLARISKEMGVEKFIHISALNCDREHEGYWKPGGSEWYKSKLRSESAVREEFPEAIIFRPSDIVGYEDRYLAYYSWKWRMERNLPYMSDAQFNLPLVNKGEGIFKQPLYVDDLAKAIHNIVIKDAGVPGQTYQATGPHRYELKELILWILRAVRRREKMFLESHYTNITDLRYFPLQYFKHLIGEYYPYKKPKPYIHCIYNGRDKVEREAVSDYVSPDLPTLEDLGVQLTPLEDKMNYLLRWYKLNSVYPYTPANWKVAEGAPYTVPGLAK